MSWRIFFCQFIVIVDLIIAFYDLIFSLIIAVILIPFIIGFKELLKEQKQQKSKVGE